MISSRRTDLSLMDCAMVSTIWLNSLSGRTIWEAAFVTDDFDVMDGKAPSITAHKISDWVSLRKSQGPRGRRGVATGLVMAKKVERETFQ
jgi:hypothetical protein